MERDFLMLNKMFKLLIIISSFVASGAAEAYVYTGSVKSPYAVQSSTGIYSHQAGVYGRRRIVAVSKEDCTYQIKLCLDEYCYDEYDGYKNCQKNTLTDFHGVVDTCLGALSSQSDRYSYANGCLAYRDSAINSYLKQMKQFQRYHRSLEECEVAEDELRAAQKCYGIAISKGGAWSKNLKETLVKACGEEVPGGSELMVEEFFNAGYMGADWAGWAANFGTLNMTGKKEGWQEMVDATLARYIDQRKVACGEGEYTVSQMGEKSSELKSSGDALRTGMVMAIVANSEKKAAEADTVGQVHVVDGSVVTAYFGDEDATTIAMDIGTALAHEARGNDGNAYVKGMGDALPSSISNGDVIVFDNNKGQCYVFQVMDVEGALVKELTNSKLRKLGKKNPYLEAARQRCYK